VVRADTLDFRGRNVIVSARVQRAFQVAFGQKETPISNPPGIRNGIGKEHRFTMTNTQKTELSLPRVAPGKQGLYDPAFDMTPACSFRG